jgi:protein-S-isoprenylcysteine O-methyltransferase Ste14
MEDTSGSKQSIKNSMRKIMPTNYFIVLLIFSIVLHFVSPVAKILYPPYTYLGWGLIIFGAIMNLWTDRLFKKYETTVKPHLEPSALITSGPFSVSRHPMYLGMASVLFGVTMIHGTISGFISPIIYVGLMELLFIPLEEKNLNSVFGTQYTEYKQKVKRWI